MQISLLFLFEVDEDSVQMWTIVILAAHDLREFFDLFLGVNQHLRVAPQRW